MIPVKLVHVAEVVLVVRTVRRIKRTQTSGNPGITRQRSPTADTQIRPRVVVITCRITVRTNPAAADMTLVQDVNDLVPGASRTHSTTLDTVLLGSRSSLTGSRRDAAAVLGNGCRVGDAERGRGLNLTPWETGL
jgi:hypothetical protein